MNEIHNVQIDWGVILKKQMDVLDKMPNFNRSGEVYAPLIEKLNSNDVPSKVHFKEGVMQCYGYMLPYIDTPDRILCSMGFASEDPDLIDLGKSILEWFITTARDQGKLLILDGVFNGNFFEKTMETYGLIAANRKKLICNLDTLVEHLSGINETISEERSLQLQIDEVDMEELCIAEENAYGDSPDRFLLIRDDGKNITPKVMLQGIYGKPINVACCVFYGSGIEGMILVTDGTYEIFRNGTPLIVDVFVDPAFRHRGTGSKLMLFAARKLRMLGHTQVQLWVNGDSQATRFYESMGFLFEGEDDLLTYLDFRS
jgi:Acetyltransferases